MTSVVDKLVLLQTWRASVCVREIVISGDKTPSFVAPQRGAKEVRPISLLASGAPELDLNHHCAAPFRSIGVEGPIQILIDFYKFEDVHSAGRDSL